MNNLLIIAGIALVIFALWKDWSKEAKTKIETEEYRKLRDDLKDAKKEVKVLLEQLEAASEKIVEEISLGLEEIQAQTLLIQPRKLTEGETVKAKSVHKAEADDSSEIAAPAKISTGASGKLHKSRANKLSYDNTVIFRSAKNSLQKEKVFSGDEQSDNQIPPRHQMVYAMARMGYPEEEIAKQMKMGKGEVSLILQLKRKGEEVNV